MTIGTETLRRIVGVAAALFALVVGAVIIAAPAAAYSREYEHATGHSWSSGAHFCQADGYEFDHPAVGCFNPSEDAIEPGDLQKDGKRVGVQWRTDYGRFGLCVNASGKDAEFKPESAFTPATGGHWCNEDLAEHHYISWRVGTCNASTTDCTKTRNWGEWSPWIGRSTSG